MTLCFSTVYTDVYSLSIQMSIHCLYRCLFTVYTDVYSLSIQMSIHCLYRCLFTVYTDVYSLSIQMSIHCLFRCLFTCSCRWIPTDRRVCELSVTVQYSGQHATAQRFLQTKSLPNVDNVNIFENILAFRFLNFLSWTFVYLKMVNNQY